MSPTGLEPATYGLKVHRSARWAKETTAQVSRIICFSIRFYSCFSRDDVIPTISCFFQRSAVFSRDQLIGCYGNQKFHEKTCVSLDSTTKKIHEARMYTLISFMKP